MREANGDSKVLGRREFLWGTGALGLGGGLGSFGSGRSLARQGAGGTAAAKTLPPGTLASVLANNCVLTPSELEGPFYKPFNIMRRNMTEGQPGFPTSMFIRVVRASDCSPIQGAIVDVWHAEHLGTYSGFLGQGTQGETWLRAVQVTDANGLVNFETVFPGWYPARVPHLHVKVFPTTTTELTTQLYFPNNASDKILELPPYDVRGPKPFVNEDDLFFHAETVFGARLLGTAALFPPGLAPRPTRLVTGLTIAVA